MAGQGRSRDATHVDNDVDNQVMRDEAENPLESVHIVDVERL